MRGCACICNKSRRLFPFFDSLLYKSQGFNGFYEFWSNSMAVWQNKMNLQDDLCIQAALAEVWNLKYGLMRAYCATVINMKAHKLCCEYWLAWVRITKWDTNLHRMVGLCAGDEVNDALFLSSARQKEIETHTKPDSFASKAGGTADVIVSEVGKQQPSSWKEWSQPLLPVPMQFIVSATVSVCEVTQWVFEMWFGLTINHFGSFLPKWKNS